MSAHQKLLIATRNRGKLRELRQLTEGLGFSVKDLGAFPNIQTVDESGKTFAENASLKATGYAKQTGLLTLTDDSGLEVDALGGAPGLVSARYAGKHSSDAERIKKLLEELAKFPHAIRSARFVCAMAIADETGTIINVSLGICDGMIAREPKGCGGFGYDPIFIPAGFEQTFAELLPTIKNRISHRARALVGTIEFLRALTSTQSAR